MANGNGNGDDTGYSGPMPDAAAAAYPQNQLITPPTQVASAPATPTSVLPPTPPPGPIEDWTYDSSLGRWVKNITPPAPQNNALQPSTTTAATPPVQPTRFDMTFGDSLATQQSTNRINPRMANNRIWGVEGPQYSRNSLPIGQSPNDTWITNEVGAPPSRIADRAEYLIAQNPDFFKTDANGNPINNIFAGIGSNVPSQLDDVGRFIDAVKKSNPNARIVIPGMGPKVPTPNVDAANAALKQVVESHGGIFFQPNLQYADGVHPANPQHMFDQANSALANATPPAAPTAAAAPAPTGLPQPDQPQPQAGTNGLAPGLPPPTGAATTPPTDLSTIYPGTKLENAIMHNENAPVGSPKFQMFSPAGAVGPAQILPSTGAPYLSKMLGRTVSNDEATQLLQDTNTNIKVRDMLLTDLKNKYSYLGPNLAPLAVAAAYHSGEGRADAWIMNEPYQGGEALGPAGKQYVANTARQLGLSTDNLNLGSYARPPLSSTSGGYGVGGAIPRAGRQAGAGTPTNPTNPLVPQLADDPAKPGGQTDAAEQWKADMARRQQQQNAIMQKIIQGAYAAQGLKGVKINPEALQSGYDPGKVLHGALEPVDRLPVSIREGAPLQMPRLGSVSIGEPRLLQVPEAARPGQAQLLQRRRDLEGI